MNYKYVENKEQYLTFLESIRESFECEEYFQDFFGIKLIWDEETGDILEELKDYKGKIETIPEEFPAILVYNFDTIEDFRYGDTSIKIFDWLTVNEINNMVNNNY